MCLCVCVCLCVCACVHVGEALAASILGPDIASLIITALVSGAYKRQTSLVLEESTHALHDCMQMHAVLHCMYDCMAGLGRYTNSNCIQHSHVYSLLLSWSCRIMFKRK